MDMQTRKIFLKLNHFLMYSRVDYIFDIDTWNKYVVTYKFCQKIQAYMTHLLSKHILMFLHKQMMVDGIFHLQIYKMLFFRRRLSTCTSPVLTTEKEDLIMVMTVAALNEDKKRYSRGDDDGSSSIETKSKTKTNLKL